MTIQTTRTGTRGALATLYAGAALTVLATLFVFVDRAGLADHIRAGYPAYQPAEIDGAVMAYTLILAVIGALGLLGWLGSAWLVRLGKGSARWVASGLLLIAACVALTGLTVQDTSGDVGLAPLLGWLQVLPCLAGLAAVVLLWRRRG
ncbi:hypothetical protein B0I32_12121 [Nonomuraea fuscirosea]|uniref:Uncharacterized protein n=1 Tax=Nonomuraea fuscirosea TaxID=1291556 RepID=A0A2T0MM53_9ACTN|nr:hypothetical protein [Nonomuraea fuscirosea]PRX58917.1 hypothetical protein B0I32_12121 [Nonomuraea fuscirosea]